MRILIWFRNDLRLHDHEPLHRALGQKAEIIPVYCFDPRQFGQTSFGFPKTGAYRAQFLLESVADLRASLQTKGSDLVVRYGKPEDEVVAIAQSLQVDAVYWHQEVTSEELASDSPLKQQLAKLKINYKTYWGATLYHPDHLPFEISQLPQVFTSFRKKVEKNSLICTALGSPHQIPPLPKVDTGSLPTLGDLGLEQKTPDKRGVLPFKGGETTGLQRLQHYFWDSDQLQVYKQTRNGMLGADYSSKFSPWLALGCLSPRHIHGEVAAYETERIRNDSTYWLVFELLWRDFFRFICAKHGSTVFYPSGLRGLKIAWKQDWPRFEQWARGETGYPLVDANMRELAATGFMSNRGRQNVASFLTKNLGIDWRMGAEWFESLLIDYDVCSNWGNWNYTAGVGNDARGFRYFNIPKQSRDYDPDGNYVKYWLPELAKLPRRKIHSPWTLDAEEQKRCHVRLGVDYPNPIVDLEKSLQTHETIYNAAVEIRRP
ncbi:DASH family cryptochrome [Leptothoe sp. PORK10 BA2]|uniref:DASH family cryptochrome n=1 Tax=Leptothoe sp. PORK10 BA2 TaxID=3110254 RepID=UPI002B201C68|nr:DASH family cryptochrome [Leptothoe sp. PORK10 BA2]MEA5466899.1 DASH family cryptochrome [Leptothoe sp. PORK10 BA2]